jgi:DHA2 family multidrug resistance protein
MPVKLAAVPQLLIAPLVAALLNIRWIDCRWMLAAGVSLLVTRSKLQGTKALNLGKVGGRQRRA